MGQSASLSVVLCAGRKTDIPYARVFKTIDLDRSLQPDLVGDVRTVHQFCSDDSLDTIVFHFCPVYLFRDTNLSSWFRKVRPQGQIIVHGPRLHQQVNVSTTPRKHFVPFKTLLRQQIRASGRRFKIGSVRETVVCVRK